VESGHLFLEYLSDSFAERQRIRKPGSCRIKRRSLLGGSVVSRARKVVTALSSPTVELRLLENLPPNRKPLVEGRLQSDLFPLVRSPFVPLCRDRTRISLAFLEMLLVQLKYVFVVGSILLIGRACISLMLPLRIHLSPLSDVGF